MRLIVCGGRDYSNEKHITETLDRIHKKKPITMIIEGGADGADKLAGEWADKNLIPRVTCPANWKYLDKAAGPRRNAVMLSLNPEGVVAFPGGRGTEDMINQAFQRGVKIMRVRPV